MCIHWMKNAKRCVLLHIELPNLATYFDEVWYLEFTRKIISVQYNPRFAKNFQCVLPASFIRSSEYLIKYKENNFLTPCSNTKSLVWLASSFASANKLPNGHNTECNHKKKMHFGKCSQVLIIITRYGKSC